MQKGRSIELEQKPQAESDLAVAAASILARESFLYSLKDMREKYGIELPKGASASVREWAVELVRKNDPEVLLETAKCHFKTTDEVLKRLNLDRAALPPAGQVTSKPTGRYFKPSKVDRNSSTRT
jgi:ribonuclease HIII